MFTRDQKDILTHTQALPCDADVSTLQSNIMEKNTTSQKMSLLPHNTTEQASIERLSQLEAQVNNVIHLLKYI